MSIVILLSLILTALYAGLILYYLVGWLLIRPFKPRGNESLQTFSILVPARNEEAKIMGCLHDLVKQDYPSASFEIIVINDHSTDNTGQVVRKFIHEHVSAGVSLRLLELGDAGAQRKLKKAAITQGVSHATGACIVLTDADCTRGADWLKTLNAFVDQTGAKMVYGPVAFKGDGLFSKIQALEFAGLVGIGAAAIQLRNPNMCSAANLLFEKKVFDEVEGYKGVDGIASGDDEFLMHKVFKRYPERVKFLLNEKAVVFTSANSSMRELTDQRRRWVSKSTKYENRYITAILVGAYIFNASIVYNLIVSPAWGLAQLLVKMVCEGVFLWSVLRFFRRTSYLSLLPLAEVFHIIYVLVIGIWANIGKYTWKGRQVK